MKRLLKTLPPILLLAFAAAGVGAAPTKTVFNRVKVELRQESSPEPNLKTTGTTGGRLRTINPHWLLIKVDYTPGQENSVRPMWCDNVELVVRVVCPGPGSKEYTAFTGVTKLWSVRLDGRTHTALMAIPPQLLDRYVSAAPGLSGNGTAITKSQVRVEALFRDSTGMLLGRGYYGGGADDFNRVFRAAGKRVVEGAVLPRDQTPWHYQPLSYYDLIRPAGVEPVTIPESAGGAPVQRGAIPPLKPPRKPPHK